MLQTENNHSAEKENSTDNVIKQLKNVLNSYLTLNPKMTVNGLSKVCPVSEPTLRRINKGQIKTLPSVSTVIDLLVYISDESNINKIAKMYPGPLGDFLNQKIGQIKVVEDLQYSEHLSKSLEDPVKYLVYKLSSNKDGVEVNKVLELFGRYGISQLEELEAEKLVYKKDCHYYSRISNYSLSNDVFVKHFKAVADYIKPHKHANANRSYSPIFANYSSSINKKAYSTILKIQRSAFKKIAQVLSDDKSSGPIPTFVLGAIDTLDKKCADEF